MESDKYWFSGVYRHFKCWAFYLYIIIVLFKPLTLSGKKCSAKGNYWAYGSKNNNKKLPRSNFCLQDPILSLATKTVSYCPESIGSIYSFSTKCLPNTQVWILIIYQPLFFQLKSGISWKRSEWFTMHLEQWQSRDKNCPSTCNRNVLFLLPVCHAVYKRGCCQSGCA